jgi:hypothetical protein
VLNEGDEMEPLEGTCSRYSPHLATKFQFDLRVRFRYLIVSAKNRGDGVERQTL